MNKTRISLHFTGPLHPIENKQNAFWEVLTSREDEVLVSVLALWVGHGQGGGDWGGETLQRHFDVDDSAQNAWMAEIKRLSVLNTFKQHVDQQTGPSVFSQLNIFLNYF